MHANAMSADVIVVGCGPTGATLSLLLAQCGVTSLVLERATTIYPLPRAVHFDDQIMRVFQALGIAESLEQVVRYNPGMRFVDPEGKLLLDWPRPAGIGDNGWHTSYRFHQPDLENRLRDNMQACPDIQLCTGVEVKSLKQHNDSVSIQCNNGEEHRAKYVVGCDGANSSVRSFIGEDIHDFGFNERWLVIDVLLKTDKPELGDNTIQHCGRNRPSTYVRCPANRRRWEISLTPEDDANSVTSDDSIWNFIGEWINADEATIERSAVYEFKSQVAKRWRKNRVFIAGDAAHLTPPFMGQGMCAGIRDVSNLAWKLSTVCKQNDTMQPSSHDTLLDSYQSERAPNVTEYIDTAMKLGALINSCRTEQALKKAFARDDGTVELKSIVPKLGPGLGVESSTHSGNWCGQPLLQNGVRLDDHVGYRAVLLANPQLIDHTKQHDGTLSELRVLSTKDEPELRSLVNSLDVQAILLRPDRYILGTAANTAELALLLEAATPWF